MGDATGMATGATRRLDLDGEGTEMAGAWEELLTELDKEDDDDDDDVDDEDDVVEERGDESSPLLSRIKSFSPFSVF